VPNNKSGELRISVS